MKLGTVYLNQRVTAKENTPLYDKGCRNGTIYYIGRGLVNVEFDYLGYVAALPPDEIEPQNNSAP